MKNHVNRREFLELTLAGGALCLAGSGRFSFAADAAGIKLISPGCRTSKVKVARLYIGGTTDYSLWPKPRLDFKDEIRSYESHFAKMQSELSDVDFAVDELVISQNKIAQMKDKLADVDGILVIHLNMGVGSILGDIVKCGKPTMIFAAPYSGHEWTEFGSLRKQPNVECLLTADYTQLARSIRPFRAIHHLKNAKICNLTTNDFTDYGVQMKDKFGTEIKMIPLDRMLKLYDSVPDADVKAEADRWIKGAEKVVEPPEEEIVKSCRLALAFEKLLIEENATVMTADCYGSMYRPLCKTYAFPCIGFTRLNDMGLGGICESDLRCAMTHIILQGLSGKPGFISDPTVDESTNSIILAHCLGSRKMDGPSGEMAPYKIRTIMERQEGAVAQVQMRKGQKVTQAILIGTDLMPYFTGEIADAPVGIEFDRGCRTKITVKVDGDTEKLWQNWSNGLHRVTCYGNVAKDLERFCKFTGVKLLNEAV